MHVSIILKRIAATALATATLSPAMAAEKFTTEQTEFFEKNVRPVLAENCYECHGAEAQKEGLRLDSRAAVLEGSDYNKVVDLDTPEASLLVLALRHDGELKMPKDGEKLPDHVADNIARWIAQGLPWPEEATPLTIEERAERHWAFQPVAKPAPPGVEKADWPRNGVDNFVLAKLEANGMAPAPTAEKRTLIRRLHYTLTGLPPSKEEIDAFVADDGPGAYAELVDRLLDNPKYGERWARHWQDVARYADTKGYVFEGDRNYAFAYTYRDWLIRALNADMPYDEFLKYQIAADHYVPLDAEDNRNLAAMGFLTLGRRFLNNGHDIIDDRIDVLTRGTMGLTVACARCHDHKFDPISMKDYYSLYGMFSSSDEPNDKPLIRPFQETEETRAFERELAKREQAVQDFMQGLIDELRQEDKLKSYLLTIHERWDASEQDRHSLAQERGLMQRITDRWLETVKGADAAHPVFGAWHRYRALGDGWAGKAPALVEELGALAAEGKANALLVEKLAETKPADMAGVAAAYAAVLAASNRDEAWQEEPREALRQALRGNGAPTAISRDEAYRYANVPAQQRTRALRREVDSYKATGPGSPPRANVLVDRGNPHDTRVFRRGQAHNQGDVAPRQFLSALAGPEPERFNKGSGRGQLAEAIASEDNPLTARVIVNRVWVGHFGQGLVTTPSDFGLRSDPPSHMELLDYLASYLMENDWSLKALHRLILNSATYRQSSRFHADYFLKDAENRLLWRMNRQRLDFEAFRDSILSATGQLNDQMFGRPVDITQQPYPKRRTIYAQIERQNLPGIFRTFDFASPDAHAPQRFTTTVPQQALFMLNSPFVMEHAKLLVESDDFKALETVEERVAFLYHQILARDPSERELALGSAFIASNDDVAASGWTYGYGQLAEGGEAVSFTPMPHFTGRSWQGGPTAPDPKLGWATLNEGGGHPGDSTDRGVIRRWTAPRDMTIRIRGGIHRPEQQGDGVHLYIVSSRSGVLADYDVPPTGRRDASADHIQVEAGEHIDFLVDMKGTIGWDSFSHIPVITAIEDPTGEPGDRTEWNGKDDFGGAPLSNWAQYAQTLLASNEFAFVE